MHTQSRRRLSTRRSLLPLIAMISVAVLQPALANDELEKARLSAVLRQLDLLDRLTTHAADVAPAGNRYQFDYTRFRHDLDRVRTGVEAYLVPERAQPRDPLPLSGDYTRSPRSEAP